MVTEDVIVEALRESTIQNSTTTSTTWPRLHITIDDGKAECS
jgi:hypothetical protein